jgi:hypothetical protein
MMREKDKQIKNLVRAIEETIALWEHRMDMWSQGKDEGEMPKFDQSMWDRLHSLRGLDADEASRFDWVLGM